MSEQLVTYTVKITKEQYDELKAIEKAVGVKREVLIPAIAKTILANSNAILPLLIPHISAVTTANITALASNGGIKVHSIVDNSEKVETPKPIVKPQQEIKK